MNWQRIFQPYILDRGHDYYCDDAVEDLQIMNNTITATVIGSDDYDVEITIKGTTITEMYCSCPYASGGNNCKHMAAVLFKWENMGSDSEVDDIHNKHNNSNKKSKSAADLVAEAEEDKVRQFLTEVLENDGKLLMRFKRLVDLRISKDDMMKYRKQVDSIVRKYAGRDHFVDYYSARGFVQELEEVLLEDVRMMIDNKCFLEAFELTNYVFLTVGKVDIDDSDGGTGDIAECCSGIWREILETIDSNGKKTMFEWFSSHLNGSIIDYMEDYIEEILMSEFMETEFLNYKLDFIDRKIGETDKKSDTWSRDYNAGKWAVYRLQIMESLGYSWEDMEKYCKDHWSLSSVRRIVIDRLLSRKEFDKAIEALHDSIRIDSGFAGLVSEYSSKLKEIYKTLGKKELYLEQLWKLALKHKIGNLEIFKELKEQYTDEEWKEKRETIFKAMPGHYGIDSLFREERLYDRLLSYVQQSFGLSALRTHMNVLKGHYPKELLQKYREVVEGMARSPSSRKQYQEIVSILREMRKITGGKELVREIASRWRIQYGKRPAMMEELGKL